MTRHQYLLSAQKMLKKQGYYTVFADNNAMEVCETKKESPFAYLVIDEDQFPGIVLCLNTGYHNVFSVANLSISLMHIAPVAMGDPFFISNDGSTYWNEDAFAQVEIESQEFLEQIVPINKEVH